MFCYQCEQTFHGKGCVDVGVCGKDHPTAALQDLLLYLSEGISMYAHRTRQWGERDERVDRFVIEALFTTVTNVNFDYASLAAWIRRAVSTRERARRLYEQVCKRRQQQPESLTGPASWNPPESLAELVRSGEAHSIVPRREQLGPDLCALVELYTYGLKGAAAYTEHALRLGKDDPEHVAHYHEALAYLAEGRFAIEDLLARCLDAGAINLQAMALLDAANTGAYGSPAPTSVRVTALRGKAIVVSGHDLRDLALVLEQTAGTGINVYTHGEMLPAHGYPELNRHSHLVGNYGGPWQEQATDFDALPGAVLMTTNCIQRPKGSYFNRIFSSGLVGWPGVTHLRDGNFQPLIDAALAQPGFAEDAPEHAVTVGFGHEAVLSQAGAIVDAVKRGAIRHFFLIGGCDGAKPGRNYYTDLARAVPKDCMILTLACGKYRFNKLDFGSVAGLPRLLDLGQCNDAYSAIRIAGALAEAFDCGLDDLPLSLVLSWYEQKAVAILLTLLHLGLKNIRLGPSLPAFVTPNVLAVLQEKYQLRAIGDVRQDLAEMLA